MFSLNYKSNYEIIVKFPYFLGIFHNFLNFDVFLNAGVKTKLLVFPEDVHAIDRPLSEAEQWMAVADWLETYLI